MKISLIDNDKTKFPNLALMKISAYFKNQGHSVEWYNPTEQYAEVYDSKVFSYTDNMYPNVLNTEAHFKGGTGHDLEMRLPGFIEHTLPDYSLYNCEHAYGFLTRGCIRKCKWCVVPKKEGSIKPGSPLQEFIGNMKSAILMDNNVLAHPFGIKQIEQIIKMGIKVDFNQGLDARLIDNHIAKLLSKVKWLKPIRLSCDTLSMIKPVIKAVQYLRWFNTTPSRYFVYVLVNPDISEAIEIVKILKGLYLDIFAQPFKDYENKIRVNQKQKDFCRWCNQKAIFKKIPFEEYSPRKFK